MHERGAYPRIDECGNCGIRVLGSWVVVTPVGHRRCAAVELIQRTRQCADVNIARSELLCESGMDRMQIFRKRPVRRN